MNVIYLNILDAIFIQQFNENVIDCQSGGVHKQ